MATKKMNTCLTFMLVALPSVCSARPPGVLTLDELFAKSDAVIIAQVTQMQKTDRYHDLKAVDFDEFSVTVRVWGSFKGKFRRGTKAVIIAYDFTGRGGPGNFGSTLRLFDKDKEKLHLLFLRKRGDTWMPTSGYVDGGNSHFEVIPSGFLFPLPKKSIDVKKKSPEKKRELSADVGVQRTSKEATRKKLLAPKG